MKVIIKGKGAKTLGNQDFLSSGGEGSVYAKAGLAYKIYADPSKMIPLKKIDELAVLNHPNIIRPLDVICNDKNKPIGYTMQYINDTFALCQLFTKSFRDREGLTTEQCFALVKRMQQGVQHVHDNKILLVDCNEMNFLVNKKFDEVYFIDVDSYQTPNFPATALMESVRDRHMKPGKFSQETDWFSWAIVTFQLFVGIHPYKGSHKSLKTLDDRMKKNISVFNSGVSCPKVVLPFDVIPKAYRDWYEAVFEKGLRSCPPDSAVEVINVVTKITKIMGTNKFDIEELEDFSNFGSIINVIYHFGTRVVQTTEGVAIGKKKHLGVNPKTKIGFTNQFNHVISAFANNGKIILANLSTGSRVTGDINGQSVMSYDGRLYIVSEGSVYEVNFVETPSNTLAALNLVANIMPKSSQVFDGVIVQNMLNAYYVSVFPTTGKHCQIRISEIEKHRIIEAKYDRQVLMIIGVDNDGKYNRFVIRFDDKFSSYDIRREDDIAPSGLNFVVLDTLNVAHINEMENLVIFRNKKGDDKALLIEDPAIGSHMRLYRWDSQAVFSSGGKLYRIKMK